MATHHPAVVLVAESAADVVAGVRFAREQGLAVTVHATGHGPRRMADAESLMIVTSRMKHFHINAAARTAWVEAGAKWAPVLEAAQEAGLAPLLGSTPDVGVVGYTLGGGLGWIGRKYGLSADNVRFIDVVTPDGVLRRASADENPDLFWALRGGGANFGVVTAIEVDLFPVREVYGGNLFYPAAMLRDVMTRYREWAKTLPDEFSSSVLVFNVPPIPEIPEPLRGQSFVMVRGAYTGDLNVGKALVDSWRAWRAPAIDMFGVMPFSQVAMISQDPPDPVGAHIASELFPGLSDEVIDAVEQYGLASSGSPITIIEFRHLGGAIRRASPELNAIGIRGAEFVCEFVTIAPTQEIWSAANDYLTEVKRILKPQTTGGMYLNFMEWQEAESRSRDAFTADGFARIQAIKMKYDPENVFSYGFNLKNRH
jgi:FAD/FMN-containing dehydrogenase